MTVPDECNAVPERGVEQSCPHQFQLVVVLIQRLNTHVIPRRCGYRVSELLEVIDAVLDGGRISVVVLADALLWSQKLSLKYNEIQPKTESLRI